MSNRGDLATLVVQNLGFEPTPEQELAIRQCADFLLSRADDQVFLLTGYAGTGKTSLVSAVVKTLRELKQPVMLLAPTGRAAKVFSLYAQTPAYTIHKKIYRQKSLSDPDTFQANVNLHKHTLFLVDEASMIANDGLGGSMFGTGRLLDDLIHYVYSCEGCRLMLIGDTAQLPPVGEQQSPALSTPVLRGYGLQVHGTCLTQVVRQRGASGILWNATQLRLCLSEMQVFAFPRLRLNGFPDIRVMPGDELIEALEDSFYHVGHDETIVITRSNKRANIFNCGIRARILDFEEELCGGDQIMVAKNNYFWAEQNRDASEPRGHEAMPFIANGDVAVVIRVHNERKFYGFRFADVLLRFPDYDNREMEVTVLLDTLQSEAPALTHEAQEQLFQAVWEDYPEIKDRRLRAQRIKEDIYYNALQIKYAYAVTCHKAQGGQWSHVYIDQGYVTQEMLSADYFRWLYTALTRATECVYLVNWPAAQVE